MMEGGKQSIESPDAESETFACPEQIQSSRKMKNKRRFTDEQIRLLESIFESEIKLEPRKKLQLARELGLQPRQVAIWFQNRRARWKYKQIEQEYKTLRTSYDNLASRFESLKNEKQSLLMQLQKLTELLGNPCDRNRSCKVLDGSNEGITSNHGNRDCELRTQVPDNGQYMSSQIDNSTDIGPAGDRGCELLNMGENVDGSLASQERWYSFDSGSQFDPSCSSSQWLNFWN